MRGQVARATWWNVRLRLLTPHGTWAYVPLNVSGQQSMPKIPGIRPYVWSGRAKATVRRQIDDELAFHFAMCVDELVTRGMTPEQAKAEAERRFGDVAAVRERLARLDRDRLGDERRADWWNALGQDVRYAVRGLRRSPAFT